MNVLSTDTTNSDKTFGLENQSLAFLIARVGLGVNLLLHGVVRMPNLSGFVNGMETKFAESLLPMFMVTPMAYAIPVVEMIIGLMLLLGITTRYALTGAAVLMMVLTTGCCFVQDWGPINSQMFLLVLAAFLIANLRHNRCCLTKDF
jgi:thiosulfate dehydrogenase [quinone] large subunit